MKVQFPAAVALILAGFLAPAAARAQDHVAPIDDVSSIDSYETRISELETELASLRNSMQPGAMTDDADFASGSSGPAWVAEFELLFLRPHKGQGVRIGQGFFDDAEFEFEASPRIMVGRVGDEGLGWRLRWFDFQHGADARERGGSILTIDTYTVDWEIFERFQLNEVWDIEVFGGSRYIGYEEDHRDNFPLPTRRSVTSWGWGGIVGMEARKKTGRNWSFYGRMRFALIGGDRWVNNAPRNTGITLSNRKYLDYWSPQIEISTGTEYSRILDNGTEVFFRWGGEWITYYNITANYPFRPGALTMQDADDVGFGGFGFSFGFYR